MIASTLLHLPNLLPGSYILKIYIGMILEGKKISPYARTTHYGLKSVKVEGGKIWNNIPENKYNGK